MIPEMRSLNEAKCLSHQSLHFFIGDANTPPCLIYKGLDDNVLYQSKPFLKVKLGEKNATETNPE